MLAFGLKTLVAENAVAAGSVVFEYFIAKIETRCYHLLHILYALGIVALKLVIGRIETIMFGR